MKLKFLSFLSILILASTSYGQIVTTINFDNESNWSAGSGRISSYLNDHTYTEKDWSFTGGPALRQTSSTQDGVAGAFGKYSWRLKDASGTKWGGTFTGDAQMTAISFDVRRWDASPAVNWSVSISFNSGSSWTGIGIIDNTFLSGSSAWETFSYDFGSVVSTSSISSSDNIMVQLSRAGGERIIVDNFKYTTVSAIPEPSTYATLLGGIALCGIYYRRRRQQKT